MTILMVDWLGRGGIAQTTEAWALELSARNVDVEVVTRGGRELGSGAIAVIAAPHGNGRVLSHRHVAVTATRHIREQRPEWVVVQDTIVPALERIVFRAASDVGARVVFVAHNGRAHSMTAGSTVGLRQNLRSADMVIAHSRFVAERVSSSTGREDVIVLPHPVPLGMLAHDRVVPAPIDGPRNSGQLWCATFGVLKRRYKGSGVFERIAAEGLDPYRFVMLGVGATTAARGIVSVPGFVEPGALVGAIAQSDVTLAPYQRATQSGAVVLAHLLGSVPVSAAVGGIPEQVQDGVDGVLVPPGSDLGVWRRALEVLTDDAHRKDLARAGEARAWSDHTEFVAGITELFL